MIHHPILSIFILFLFGLAKAETYDATVTTDSGSYVVPVEIENGEVTTVYWPNGGDMTVSGADIIERSASGFNSRGESVDIEIDGYDDEVDMEQ